VHHPGEVAKALSARAAVSTSGDRHPVVIIAGTDIAAILVKAVVSYPLSAIYKDEAF